MKREKVFSQVLAGVIGGFVALFVLQPLAEAYKPTRDQVRDFFGDAWNWLNGPEAGLWFFMAICGVILYAAWRNMRQSRWSGLAVCVGSGVAGGAVYRVSNGYPAGADPIMDPAAWIVAGGFAVWVVLARIVPSVYRSIAKLLADELADRDWRWILREREAIDAKRGVQLDKRHRCNVPEHRAMKGYETCDHELKAARSRSRRARWHMEGELPQVFRYPGSPGYDSAVKRSELEPVLSREELAELEATKNENDFVNGVLRVARVRASEPTPGTVEGAEPAAPATD